MARKFHLMAGRTFYLDGRPAFYIGIGALIPGLSPTEVDAITRRIAVHLARPCPYCNDDPRGLSRTRAVKLKVGNAAMKCPLCP